MPVITSLKVIMTDKATLSAADIPILAEPYTRNFNSIYISVRSPVKIYVDFDEHHGKTNQPVSRQENNHKKSPSEFNEGRHTKNS
jgi:hypothetical protein